MRAFRKLILSAAGLALGLSVAAQEVKKYETFIYSDPELADDIQRENENQDATRRFDADLLNATLGSLQGLGGGYVSALVNMGVNAIGSLVTRNSRQKKEWEEMVGAENRWEMKIASVQDVKDFYQKPSMAGALDPMNMTFDGIGCLRREGNDTVFFVSCHIDRSKLNRIVNHSKFELVLDTLIITPSQSNLPNTPLPLEFNFEQRRNFNFSMNIKLTSSWFTDAIELHSDEKLGEFTLNVPVDPSQLDAKGRLRYVRDAHSDDVAPFAIVGESFIIPRSYMGYRDQSGRYHNIWGTGQYKIDVTLAETCDITDRYRENWKADRKYRESLKPKQSFWSSAWQSITRQHWDEITRSWVITTLSAPAGVISTEMINRMGLIDPKAASKGAGAAGAQAAGKGAGMGKA